MKLRDLLKTSFENLTRHKARTALTTATKDIMRIASTTKAF